MWSDLTLVQTNFRKAYRLFTLTQNCKQLISTPNSHAERSKLYRVQLPTKEFAAQYFMIVQSPKWKGVYPVKRWTGQEEPASRRESARSPCTTFFAPLTSCIRTHFDFMLRNASRFHVDFWWSCPKLPLAWLTFYRPRTNITQFPAQRQARFCEICPSLGCHSSDDV